MFTKNDKGSARRFSLESFFGLLAMLTVLAVATVFLFGFASTKQITIVDGETTIKATTTKVFVEEALAEQKVFLRPGDRISVAPEEKLKNNEVITITRGKTIYLTTGGSTKEFYSCEDTLGKALKDADITLDEHDELSPAPETPVTEGMSVSYTNIDITIVKEDQLMSFYETKIPLENKEKGYINVIQEGDTGWAEATYQVTTRDGVVVDKLMLVQNVIVAPVERIVEYGVYEPGVVQTSRGGVRYKKVLECKATAYDPSPESNGGYGGLTATGLKAQYGVIAVDPRVIPLGSKVYVESADGGKSWVYGFAIAADTGGAIKGNRVDLCYNTRRECIQFGRRNCKVYVLE
ncbi:MAG: DUF348 domain-containing protein [Clostridia bacterium]|nr:DUF348 domain-containing protein [Clostridia bacterium]